MKTLIVDDIRANRELLSLQLKTDGYEVVECSDGLEALKALAQYEVGIVISDIHMPNMDGFQLCRTLRENVLYKDIPFIFYSATYTSWDDKKFTTDLGGDLFIKKPSPIGVVTAAMEDLLKNPDNSQRSKASAKMRAAELIRAQQASIAKRRDTELADATKKLKASQAEISVAHDQLKNIFDSLDEVFFSLDTVANQLLQVSPACEKVYGLPQQAFFDNPRLWFERIHPDDRERVGGEFAQTQKGIPRKWECRIVKPSGEIRWIETIVKPTLDEKGVVIRLEGIVRDISERRRLENENRQMQKMESLGNLAAGIAHDFNNILGIIIGYVDALLKANVSPQKTKAYLDTINQAAFRGAGLVKQLLTFARKGDVVLGAMSAKDAVLETVNLIRETFPKNIKIEVLLGDKIPLIIADANQLHQVFLNLSVNARDAMPAGGILTFTIELMEGSVVREKFSAAREPFYVTVKISDTGVGMDEETRQKIFEPFFTTKERNKGTGLGLATVFGIMEGHDGFIEVESTLGKGTTFNIYFPARAIEAVQESQNVSTTAKSLGGTETVLLIEDEKDLRDIAQTMLEGRGYTVLTAGTGPEAIKQYELNHSKIDIVMSDLDLPGTNGRDVFLKLCEINPKVKTIIISGLLEPVKKAQMSKDGIIDFIKKPFIAEQLLTKLRAALDTKK